MIFLIFAAMKTLAAMKTELGAAVIDALPPSMICRFIRGT